MASSILNPGSNDDDFLFALTRPRKDKKSGAVPTRLTLKKVALKPGASSKAPVGDTMTGSLEQEIRPGHSVKFTDTPRRTSGIEKIEVQSATGKILLHTSTSIYEVLNVDTDSRRTAILQYMRHGYLDFDQIMPDGFTDGGRYAYLSFDAANDGYVMKSGGREVIYTNADDDPRLKALTRKAKEVPGGIFDMRQKIVMLAMLVSNEMGGSLIDGNPSEKDAFLKASDDEIATLTQGNTKPLRIGDLRHGVCRHRGILFKYLADRCGIPSRLIRGDYVKNGDRGGHVWNVVKLNGKFFIVDVMHNAYELYEQGSEKATHYIRKAGDGARGGMGGRSIKR